MSPADRWALYRIIGLEVTLAGDHQLRIGGPQLLRDLARPSLLKHRDELIAELQRTAEV